ncbi:MAG: OmpA family protein [Bacteroidales bacterium]|jgi:chemotaxis protein MotB|nr:OmpA family protein [Bacteroidales bacterium]
MHSKFTIYHLLFILLLFFTGCVPAKQFEELQQSARKCEEERELLNNENKHLTITNTELEAKTAQLQKRIENLQEDSVEKTTRLRTIEIKYDKINKQYHQLQESQDQLLSGNIDETRKLLRELQNTQSQIIEKEDELRKLEDNLRAERSKLNAYEQELESKNARLVELETILHRKDSVVNVLKDKVSKALVGFTDEGLAVDIRNGKVYVSLEEQLLFKSGSTEVDPKGVSALKKLAGVLSKNPDINIMVEGHTDDVPYIPSEAIQDNWDLSVKRATAIIRILMEDSNIKGDRIIAAGRSKYVPIEAGKSAEARKKNRRTEIILTPKLDELFKILEAN